MLIDVISPVDVKLGAWDEEAFINWRKTGNNCGFEDMMRLRSVVAQRRGCGPRCMRTAHADARYVDVLFNCQP